MNLGSEPIYPVRRYWRVVGRAVVTQGDLWLIMRRRMEQGMQHWRMGEGLGSIAVMVSPSSNSLDKKGALKTHILDRILFVSF